MLVGSEKHFIKYHETDKDERMKKGKERKGGNYIWQNLLLSLNLMLFEVLFS